LKAYEYLGAQDEDTAFIERVLYLILESGHRLSCLNKSPGKRKGQEQRDGSFCGSSLCHPPSLGIPLQLGINLLAQTGSELLSI
jgi:hypothetical protein